MKKFLLIAVLCISTISAYASGLRSFDMRANLRSDLGLGIGLTFDLPKGFEAAPSLNYYFNGDNTLTIDGDFRYRFDLPRNFSIYPLAGILFFHTNHHDHGCNKVGLNIGGGFGYDINSNWNIGLEVKYQYVNDWDDVYLSLGVSYLF